VFFSEHSVFGDLAVAAKAVLYRLWYHSPKFLYSL